MDVTKNKRKQNDEIIIYTKYTQIQAQIQKLDPINQNTIKNKSNLSVGTPTGLRLKYFTDVRAYRSTC